MRASSCSLCLRSEKLQADCDHSSPHTTSTWNGDDDGTVSAVSRSSVENDTRPQRHAEGAEEGEQLRELDDGSEVAVGRDGGRVTGAPARRQRVAACVCGCAEGEAVLLASTVAVGWSSSCSPSSSAAAAACVSVSSSAAAVCASGDVGCCSSVSGCCCGSFAVILHDDAKQDSL